MKNKIKKYDLKKFYHKQLLKPTFLKLVLNDFFNFNKRIFSNEIHLKYAIEWIINAQKATKDGGVSKSFSIISGWEPSYPETSGYIIPTLFDYYHFSKNENYVDICKLIADWEYSIQLNNGGFQAGAINEVKRPSIFNTGQIILGLIRAYRELNNEKYLDAVKKAGDFLLRNQNKDGSWSKYCFKNKVHTYNVRTAWALLELFQITDQIKYKEGAIKNIEWALKQKRENHWFDYNDSIYYKRPLLHFICYTIRGILESGKLLEDNSLIEISLKSTLPLLNFFLKNGKMAANFDSNWNSVDNYNILPANAQLSIIWLKLYEIYKDRKLLACSKSLNYYLKSKQIIYKKHKEVHGAIKGSDPIWGDYTSFRFPNWAVKFFCDALIQEIKLTQRI